MSSRPCVFLLPGLMCDEAIWDHQKAALAPYADVRIPVFRGFSSLRAMAESVLENAPQRFSVVGHSMGGKSAMVLALTGKNRARWSGKHDVADVFDEWLRTH